MTEHTPTDLLEPFSEQNCGAWAELIRKLLAPDTSFEVRMPLLHQWETKGQAQFLRAISTLQSVRASHDDLWAALAEMIALVKGINTVEGNIPGYTTFGDTALPRAEATLAKAKA